MKTRVVTVLAGVFAMLLSLLCFILAKTNPPQAAEAPATQIPHVSVVDSLPEIPLESRDLIFYPPGKAPSEDMEFDPVPFESLLPGSEGDEAIPVDNG